MTLVWVHLTFAGGGRWHEKQVCKRFHLACCQHWPDLWITIPVRNIPGPSLHFSGIDPCGTWGKGTIHFPWCDRQGQWSSSFWVELLRTVATSEGECFVLQYNHHVTSLWSCQLWFKSALRLLHDIQFYVYLILFSVCQGSSLGVKQLG